MRKDDVEDDGEKRVSQVLGIHNRRVERKHETILCSFLADGLWLIQGIFFFL